MFFLVFDGKKISHNQDYDNFIYKHTNNKNKPHTEEEDAGSGNIFLRQQGGLFPICNRGEE